MKFIVNRSFLILLLGQGVQVFFGLEFFFFFFFLPVCSNYFSAAISEQESRSGETSGYPVGPSQPFYGLQAHPQHLGMGSSEAPKVLFLDKVINLNFLFVYFCCQHELLLPLFVLNSKF